MPAETGFKSSVVFCKDAPIAPFMPIPLSDAFPQILNVSLEIRKIKKAVPTIMPTLRKNAFVQATFTGIIFFRPITGLTVGECLSDF